MVAHGSSSQFRHVLSATRMHFPPENGEIPPATEQHLRAYMRSIKALGIQAAIAVNAQQARVQKIAEELGLRELEVLHVPVWGAFVPALNALLGVAQRRKMRYILYQSLEVQCSPEVLQYLLNHITKETLVVGPVLDGHTFAPGEQPLNGRTSPWNTLAVWATRQLAVTGFLSIADGLPAFDGSKASYLDVVEPAAENFSPTMGSDAWWIEQSAFSRQQSHESVPAGVEEVTAIALLQHLHGPDQARALLVRLPEDVYSQMEWKASWGGDEGRRKWHEEKMASKVARPQAQLKQLFSWRRKKALQQPLLYAGDGAQNSSEASSPASEERESFVHGVVLHFEKSIPPPRKVQTISLSSVFLFSANVAMVFASAFRAMNGSTEHSPIPGPVFGALLLGGIYVPMPLSLWLTRRVISCANHIGGFIFFHCTQLLAHPLIIFLELRAKPGFFTQGMLLLARLLQGLGSGTTFHARYMLVASSTLDHHMDAQTLSLYASDLGIVVGTLLPAVSTFAMYSTDCLGEWAVQAPDLLPCAVLSIATFVSLLWVVTSFPRRPHLLPDKVRMYGMRNSNSAQEAAAQSGGCWTSIRASSAAVLVSGTAPTVAQSALIVTLAMLMRDEGYVGDYRQTVAIAVAVLFLVAAPLAILLGLRCCKLQVDASTLSTGCRLVLLLTCFWPLLRFMFPAAYWGVQTVEVVLLLVALSLGRPLALKKVFEQPAPEKTLAQLEWMKAYIGRLLAPLMAVLVYQWMGFTSMVLVMVAATASIPLLA
mmetsp:Transcript_58789/g.108542  ORF Transcript_58789/g.108542 Transcript_58789/m.108542 type:complete len:766 (-) Transcript_58789:42-2339(-)